jgi:hypothetical protein
MWTKADVLDLVFTFRPDPGVDKVRGEDTVADQKIMVAL